MVQNLLDNLIFSVQFELAENGDVFLREDWKELKDCLVSAIASSQHRKKIEQLLDNLDMYTGAFYAIATCRGCGDAHSEASMSESDLCPDCQMEADLDAEEELMQERWRHV